MTKEQSDSCPSVPALNRASRARAIERLSFVVGADNDLCHPSLVGDWGPLPKEGRVFDPLFHKAQGHHSLLTQYKALSCGLSVGNRGRLTDGVHINSLIGVEGGSHQFKQFIHGLIDGGSTASHSDRHVPKGVGHRLELFVSPRHWYLGYGEGRRRMPTEPFKHGSMVVRSKTGYGV